MTAPVLSFAVVLLVQLSLFLGFALYHKKFAAIPSQLGWGLLVGVVVGIPTDFVVGKLLGVYSYVLGFGPLFLLANTLFSYGLFAANVLWLRTLHLFNFYLGTVLIMGVYEVANYFFPVWHWEFVLPQAASIAVLSGGYFFGAVVVATALQVLSGRRFRFLRGVLGR